MATKSPWIGSPRLSACPHCGAKVFERISRSVSRVPGRVAYRICGSCGTSYIPPERLRAGAGGVAAIVFGSIAGFVGIGLLMHDSPWWGVLLIFLSVPLVFLGVATLWEPEPSHLIKTAEMFPDDGGKPSARLVAWLNAQKPASFWERSSRNLVGAILIAVGTILMLAFGGTAVNKLGDQIPGSAFGQHVIFVVCCGIIAMLGHLFASKGKSIAALSVKDVLRADGPRPIILLRAFRDDGMTLSTADGASRRMSGFAIDPSMEDRVVKVFRSVGPVVAVARPTDRDRSGAARVWLDNSEWQDWVSDLIEWSQWVFMVLGDPGDLSDRVAKVGLSWEIDQVFRSAASQKILVFVPPNLRPEVAKHRWDQWRKISRGNMPEYEPKCMLLCYASNWVAHIFTYDNEYNACEELESLLKSIRDLSATVFHGSGTDCSKLDETLSDVSDEVHDQANEDGAAAPPSSRHVRE